MKPLPRFGGDFFGEHPVRVATLNTWHGLDGQGALQFGALEKPEDRKVRLRDQLEVLRHLGAHILCLQEVNPLPFKALEYAWKLDRDCFFWSANMGIKLGWGIPWNFNEGSALFLPKSWKGRWVGHARLSGRFRAAPFRLSEIFSPLASVQIHEARLAVAARGIPPLEDRPRCLGGAPSVLVVGTHLHHQPARTPRTEALLFEERKRGMLPDEEQQARNHFEAANSRRLSEVDTLLHWIQSIREPHEPVFLCGDFNCEAGSAPLEALRRQGWIDLWENARASGDWDDSATWEPRFNPHAGHAGDFYKETPTQKGHWLNILRGADGFPRRIDFLFFLPPQAHGLNPTQKLLGFEGVGRFGVLEAGHPMLLDAQKQQKPREGLTWVSDHMGVYADFF